MTKSRDDVINNLSLVRLEMAPIASNYPLLVTHYARHIRGGATIVTTDFTFWE